MKTTNFEREEKILNDFIKGGKDMIKPIYEIGVEDKILGEKYNLTFNVTKKKKYGMLIELKKDEAKETLIEEENICEDSMKIIKLMNSLVKDLSNKQLLETICEDIKNM